MNQSLYHTTLGELVKAQHPDQIRVAENLSQPRTGFWESPAYFRFVSQENANQPGAVWQHKECIVVESEAWGDIVIDVLADDVIGGFEFLAMLHKSDYYSVFSLLNTIDLFNRGKKFEGTLISGKIAKGDVLCFATNTGIFLREIIQVDFVDRLPQLMDTTLALTITDFPTNQSESIAQPTPQRTIIDNR